MVLSSHTWGINALILPRIHANPDSYSVSNSTKKRKHAEDCPPFLLFDALMVHLKHGSGSVQQHSQMPNRHVFCSQQFDYDLQVVNLPYSHFLRATSIVSDVAALFLLSKHPVLEKARLTLPKPADWIFYTHDRIIDMSNHREGVVQGVGHNAVEVEYAEEEGIFPVSFAHIRKIFGIGDYVHVLSGTYQGRSGWVQYVEHVSQSSVEILEQAYDRDYGLEIEVC